MSEIKIFDLDRVYHSVYHLEDFKIKLCPTFDGCSIEVVDMNDVIYYSNVYRTDETYLEFGLNNGDMVVPLKTKLEKIEIHCSRVQGSGKLIIRKIISKPLRKPDENKKLE